MAANQNAQAAMFGAFMNAGNMANNQELAAAGLGKQSRSDLYAVSRLVESRTRREVKKGTQGTVMKAITIADIRATRAEKS